MEMIPALVFTARSSSSVWEISELNPRCFLRQKIIRLADRLVNFQMLVQIRADDFLKHRLDNSRIGIAEKLCQ